MKTVLSKDPILVIDRDGLIGEPLSLKLSQEFPIVYVGQSDPDQNFKSKNIIHAPFSKKIPVIPDNEYSQVVFIDEVGKDLELLPKIIEKVKSVNADLIIVLGWALGEKYMVDKIMQEYPSAKVVILGDIFDTQLILRREGFKSVINKYIYQAQKFGRMQILGEGLREAYPVLLSDAVDGLIDLIFGIQKTQSLFYLFPKHPVSELSLAHMIQKMNPEVTIDFIRHDSRLRNSPRHPDGKYLLKDRYLLAQKIRNIDIAKKPKLRGAGPERKKKNSMKFPLFIFWILLFLIFAPLVFTSLFSFFGLSILSSAKGEMDKGNFVNAKRDLRISQAFFSLGKQTSSTLLIRPKNLSQNLDLGLKISEGMLQIFNSGDYFYKVLSGKSVNLTNDFTKGENYLKNSIIALDKIRVEEKIPAPFLQNLEIVNPLIRLLSASLDVLPDILGMEGPKIYLILFQDNMELRPGGGLITTYGILKFDMGKITDFSVHDISDADSQLRGHVEPPFAVRRYLPSEHWYMRDSNFDVDFVQSALSASNFIFVETGERVSGVIAIDNSLLKNILKITGPVNVVNFKEKVDEKNLDVLMQKKDFTKDFYKSIITKVTGEKTSLILIAQAISDALNQKHLLLEFNDMQNIFTVNGWSSSLWDERVNGEERINDFLGINEANLGMNKANAFISRQVTQTIKIEPDGSLFGELNLSYKNDGNSLLPDGNYKNYLRVILPQDTLLNSLSINGVLATVVDAVIDPKVYGSKNFKIQKGIEIEKTFEDKKAIFGFLVNVPAGGLVKIKIQYTVLRKELFNPNNFSYNLKIFKQPGIDYMPYSFSLYYPDNLSVVSADGFKKDDNPLLYSEKIIKDKGLIIYFTQK